MLSVTQPIKKCTLSTFEKVFFDHQYTKGVFIIQKLKLLFSIDALIKVTLTELKNKYYNEQTVTIF